MQKPHLNKLISLLLIVLLLGANPALAQSEKSEQNSRRPSEQQTSATKSDSSSLENEEQRAINAASGEAGEEVQDGGWPFVQNLRNSSFPAGNCLRPARMTRLVYYSEGIRYQETGAIRTCASPITPYDSRPNFRSFAIWQPAAQPGDESWNDQSSSVPAVGAAKPPVKAGNPMSEELNRHMPGWLKMNGEYRMRFETKSGQRGVAGSDDSYFLSRFRLSMTMKPSEQWTLFIQGQDSHVFGFATQPPPSNLDNNFDLRQAYLDYRSGGKQGWAVRIGRQEFKYGDERVIGASDWSNTARSFDAIKVSAFGSKYALDLFASSVVVSEDGVFDKHRDGQNLYGLHATFPTLVPKAEVNVYTFWRTTPLVSGERSSRGDSDTVTLGTRLAGKLPMKFDYTMEAMLQRGSFALDRVRAYAFHGRLGYTIRQDYWTPKLLIEYNQSSGDENPNDGVRGTYDQLFPTNHSKYGIDDVVGFRNLENLRLGFALQPNKRTKIEGDYHSFWLTQVRDGLYNEQGNLITRNTAGAAGKHVAQEADLQFTYTPKEYLSFGAVYAHWFPGEYWKATTKGAPGSSVYTYATYRF